MKSNLKTKLNKVSNLINDITKRSNIFAVFGWKNINSFEMGEARSFFYENKCVLKVVSNNEFKRVVNRFIKVNNDFESSELDSGDSHLLVLFNSSLNIEDFSRTFTFMKQAMIWLDDKNLTDKMFFKFFMIYIKIQI